MTGNKKIITISFILLTLIFNCGFMNAQDKRPMAKKILLFGDSMTGWLAERLEAYGKQNGFEVASVTWDGSNLSKWGKSAGLPKLINEQKPDVIFVNLGMNDYYISNPEVKLKDYLASIRAAAGKTPIIWIGALKWPGKNLGEPLNKWLAKEMGEGHYFRSYDLELERQSATNPHLTRQSTQKWGDEIIDWIKKKGAIQLPGYNKPVREQMSRGKVFVYKRLKEKF